MLTTHSLRSLRDSSWVAWPHMSASKTSWVTPSATAGEFLADEHPQVQAFVGRGAAPPDSSFSRLDADFVRVLEDVIDTLIVRNVLNITDLPAEAQAKLFARKTFRDRVSKDSLRLFDFQPSQLGDVI